MLPHGLYVTRVPPIGVVLCGFRHEGACHDSSRVSAMPTNRAYVTCYAMHTNMPTHGLHGLHAVIIMDLDVHGHALYKYRHDTLQPPMVA